MKMGEIAQHSYTTKRVFFRVALTLPFLIAHMLDLFSDLTPFQHMLIDRLWFTVLVVSLSLIIKDTISYLVYSFKISNPKK